MATGDADDDELWAELDTASAKKREEAVRAVKSKVKQPKSTEAERTGGKREKKRKQSAKDAQSNAATIASAAPVGSVAIKDGDFAVACDVVCCSEAWLFVGGGYPNGDIPS